MGRGRRGVTLTSWSSNRYDVECLSKYCPTCKINSKKDHPNCLTNHQGSSGGMEVAGVVKIFQRSEESPVPARYVHFLSGWDCKSFDAMTQLTSYREVTIDKLECINHVEKRMGTRLRVLRKTYKKKLLPDGKKLSRKGPDTVINNLQEYYGKAIRSSKTLEAMKEACWATYYHKGSTDADPQHGLCLLGGDSWCKYNRAAANGLPCPEHTYSIPTEVMTVIKPVYQDLCSPNLLRCLHGNTQNCNEASNNVIWSRIPKNTFLNEITLKIGVLDSVIAYNEGALAKVKVLQDLCGKAGGNCVVGLQNSDAKRVREAERALLEIKKRPRKAKKIVKRRLEANEDEDGPSYGAGLF